MEQVLTFRDHDGLMLEIVEDPGADVRTGWSGAPGVSGALPAAKPA